MVLVTMGPEMPKLDNPKHKRLTLVNADAKGLG